MKHIEIPDHLVRGPILSEAQFDFLMKEVDGHMRKRGLDEYVDEVRTAIKINAGAIANSEKFIRFIAEAVAYHLEKLLADRDPEISAGDKVEALRSSYSIDDSDISDEIAAIAFSLAIDRRPGLTTDKVQDIVSNHGYLNTEADLFLVMDAYLTESRRARGGLSCEKVSDIRLATYCQAMSNNIGVAYMALAHEIPLEKMTRWMDASHLDSDAHIHPGTLLLIKHMHDESVLNFVLKKVTPGKSGDPSVIFMATTANDFMALVDLEMAAGDMPSPIAFDVARCAYGGAKAETVYAHYLANISQKALNTTAAQPSESLAPVVRAGRLSI